MGLEAFNLRRWVEENRHRLKPPVGNEQLWKEDHPDFVVMVVGGPNSRKDFHVEEGPELFYQLEGDIVVRVVENGKVRDIAIREGDIFLLPARVPHSPQRTEGSIGLVVERKRLAGEEDRLQWYCENCGKLLYDEAFVLTDITTQLKEIMERFWAEETRRTCSNCGAVMQKPAAAESA